MKFNDNLLTKHEYTQEECLRPNKTIHNMWSWAQALEVLGIICAIGVAIFGLVTAIGAGKLASALDQRSTFKFGTFLTTFLPFVLYAFLTYCGFHALALIISAIGNITYNSLVSAKAALTQTFHSGSQKSDSNKGTASTHVSEENPWAKLDTLQKAAPAKADSATDHNYWLCPKCGKRQPNAVVVCGCGQRRDEALDVTQSQESWICPDCGRKNAKQVLVCSCGHKNF